MTAGDSIRQRSGLLGCLLLVLLLGSGVWWLTGGREPVSSPETAIWGEFRTLPLVPQETVDVGGRAERTLPGESVSSEFELLLRFSADSWAEASDGEGERLLYELAPAGQTRTVRGTLPFTLAFGNAAAVDLLVAGRVIAAGTDLPARGGVARFHLVADPAAVAGVNVVSPDNRVVRASEIAPAQDDAPAAVGGPRDSKPALVAIADAVPNVTEPAGVRLRIRGVGPGGPGELLRIAADGLSADRIRTLLLDDPPRAVVDLLDAELADGIRAASDHPDVIRVRIGRHSDRIRIVLDLRQSRTVATRVEDDRLIVR